MFKIASAAKIQGLEALDKVSVDQDFEFFVESGIEPVVEILGPARRVVPVTVDEVLSRNGFNVKFRPVDVGDHSVSPFL